MPVATHEISHTNPWFASLMEQLQEGGEVVLTQQGKKIARLLPIKQEALSAKEQRRALVERLQKSVASKAIPGPDAAHSQDFLYDENGLPT